MRYAATMYIIRLQRRVGAKDDVTMWLTSVVPMRWGERNAALKLDTKGAAWRVAGTLKVQGAWSVEEV